MTHLAMKNMALPPPDPESEGQPISTPYPVKTTGPNYPFGLSIRLEKDQLDKLGLDMPEIGDTVEFDCLAKVTSVSQRDSDVGGPYRCVELQIIAMGAEEPEDDETSESGDAGGEY